MPADETQSQKSSIYIFGGFPKYREEVETTLKSFYELKFFEDLERAGEDVFKVAPKAIMVDEIVPPKGEQTSSPAFVKSKKRNPFRLFFR